MGYVFERPEPTTLPPDLSGIRKQMEHYYKTIKTHKNTRCEYCGRITKSENELCPSCGAPLSISESDG